MSYNKATIIGNLGADPELRYLDNGTAVTSFSVATNLRWTDKDTGEKREKLTWFRVTAWRKLAETCAAHLKKGRQVFVEGRIAASAYLAQDGEARATLELSAQNVVFLGSGNGNKPPDLSEEDLADDADIPF
jgi:single-strand DNA-binding protein